MSAEDDMARIAAAVRRLEHTVFGNGTIGLTDATRRLTESVGGLTANVTKIGEKVDALTEARAAEENQRIGSEKTLRQIRALVLLVVAVVGLGGGAVTLRLFELLGTLQ